jgi:hypothetical protein
MTPSFFLLFFKFSGQGLNKDFKKRAQSVNFKGAKTKKASGIESSEAFEILDQEKLIQLKHSNRTGNDHAMHAHKHG